MFFDTMKKNGSSDILEHEEDDDFTAFTERHKELMKCQNSQN